MNPISIAANGDAPHAAPEVAAFHRFLRAKVTVDSRALHGGVYGALRERVAAMEGERLRVLEIGCGVGTMLERLDTWGLWDETSAHVVYTALDREPENTLALDPSDRARLTVLPVCSEFHAFAAGAIEKGERWDLVIAHAVLDLFDVERALPLIRALLGDEGVAWLTLNFDGGTILLPTIDRNLDDLIEARYHRTMDERVTDGAPSGDSRTGRHLFTALPAAGFEILAAGASDWIVHPAGDGYPAREGEFLRFIVATIAGALAEDEALDQARFQQWIAERFEHIEGGKLVYLAKQYDFLAGTQKSSTE